MNNKNKKTPKKVTYEVMENETINDCLNRIQKDGYLPIRRIEKPIFHEVNEGGQLKYEPAGRQIIFEAKKVD
jgi:hypothetical protein